MRGQDALATASAGGKDAENVAALEHVFDDLALAGAEMLEPEALLGLAAQPGPVDGSLGRRHGEGGRRRGRHATVAFSSLFSIPVRVLILEIFTPSCVIGCNCSYAGVGIWCRTELELMGLLFFQSKLFNFKELAQKSC